MKRSGLRFVGAALLIFLLPTTLSSCASTCGCASTPNPNWTPAQITAQEAASDAAALAGVDAMAAELHSGLDGRQFFLASAGNTVAFVDSTSGIVLEVIYEDQMPNDATTSLTKTDARAAAETFITRTGMATVGLTEVAEFKTVANVSAYEVRWTDSIKGDFYEVSINAATGAVFAFLDQRMHLSLIAPIIGRAGATVLATGKTGMDVEQVTSTHFSVDFSSSIQVSTWDVRLGSTLVRIDAATGVGNTIES